MMRAVIIGLLAAAAAVAGEMASDKVGVDASPSPGAGSRTTEARKTHEINVPRIKDGAIKGYAVMMLSYRSTSAR